MISPLTIAAILVLSYLAGSIPTGYWLGKMWKGVDVRQHGSGNLGATNVFRVLGTSAGVTTLLIDIFKGMAPVLMVKQLYPGLLGIAAAAGLAAIIGHTTSMFVGFHGGKGVATSAGVFIALLPVPALIAVAMFALSFAVSRRVSVGSLTAAVALASSAFFLSEDIRLAYVAMGAACLVFWTHRGNIQRILAGTEPRLGSKGSA